MNKLNSWLINLWNDEEGLGTLEILLIVAVLVGVAVLFGDTLVEWVKGILEGIDPTPADI